jgi:hypothetical protein
MQSEVTNRLTSLEAQVVGGVGHQNRILEQSNPREFNLPLEGRPGLCSPSQLRLHPALNTLGWTGEIDELNDAALLKNQSVSEPILITTNGTVLAGFGRWRLAVLEGAREIECIEYPLSEHEALQFILAHHQTRRGWNRFVLICLALTLEPYFQKKALDNMRAGGRYKGSANLPEAQRIDVREQVAMAAGVGSRNISNVKIIMKTAHPRLIEALKNGTLTIHGAMLLCKSPRAEQLERFIRQSEERAINKIIRRSIKRLQKGQPVPDVVSVLTTLRQQEERQPGSVEVQVGDIPRTVIQIGQDVLTASLSNKESELT